MDIIGELIATTVRIASPIMLAGAGGLLSMQVGVDNIALEGIMLASSFASVWASFHFQSVSAALGAAVLAGIITNLILVIFVRKLKSDNVISGLAINTLAWGVTSYLLVRIFDTSGAFVSEDIVPIPRITVPLLSRLPVIGGAFQGQSTLTYLAPLILLVLQFVLYQTRYGLWIRAVGESPETARALGLRTSAIVYLTSIVVGALCGLGGAQISLGFLAMFSENMTAGRGFMAYAALIFGQSVPFRVLVITFLFGLAEAMGLRLQLLRYPPQFILMVPYVVTVLSLTVASSRTRARRGP